MWFQAGRSSTILRHELDRRAVFARSWQLLAQESQLAHTGDHVVGEIAGVPLLIARGDDGELRALHNVCRHRAGPLALCDGRGAKRLRCHYHGWTYALDGQLLSAPEMQTAADFNIASVRLPQARVASWRGLVFVSLDQHAPPLDELLDGMDARLGDHAIENHAFHARESYDIACNWKTYIDNYLEGYHVPHIHPELNRMLDYRSYVVETSRWHSLQHSPLESGDALYGSGEALYWFVWPNTMLNVMPGRMQTNRVLPIGPEHCRVVFDYYYPAAGERRCPISARSRLQRPGSARGRGNVRARATWARIGFLHRGPIEPAARERRAPFPRAFARRLSQCMKKARHEPGFVVP